jgi:hypothetical protein
MTTIDVLFNTYRTFLHILHQTQDHYNITRDAVDLAANQACLSLFNEAIITYIKACQTAGLEPVINLD